ncbi:MAG: PKD domain-containing protein [Marinoscillum sp.]|uniref:PKD domain-containing protein n=3 Tax=Marinoscillum sp. TaxID=2024838 RepID=UPI0032F73CBC
MSERYSQEETPLNVNYEVSGWHYITLKVTDASSNVAYVVDSVYVKSAVTPPVEFSIDESRCISNTNVFTSIEDVSISSYEWDLGGGSFGEGDLDTSYQYPSSGAYEVRLRVGSENGCENTSTQTIHIYDSPPAPVVNAPDPICMASEILFDNSTDTTGFGSGGLQWNWWLWSLPSDTVHTYQYSHEFMSSGNDTLYVQAYVPGCTTQLEIPFEVIEVSLTYRYSQNCYGEATLFEGVVDSPESVDSVHWDFGDGFESTDGLMVSHQYGAKGSYPLQLYVRNINGCTTVIDTIFEVQDSVLVAIDSMDVIENIPVSITSSDLTLETDSIIQYRWYINGVESSDQWAFERSFPAGSVDLSLSVLTAQGCSDSVVYSFTVAEALCPTAAINVSDTVCLQQNLELLNSSVNGGAGYQWDFCGLRLSDSYTVESSMSTGGGSPRGASFGKSGDSWYGFVTVRDNKNLLRLSFGSSLSNTPSVVNLGNPGGLFELVDQIELYREGDQWYGLVVNDQGSNNLIRLSFGSSLTGTPTAENLGNFGGVLNRPRGIAIREDDGDVIVGVTNFGSRTVAMLNFGSSISSALGSITYLESGVIPGDQIIDLEIGKDCDSWYGFVGSRATVDKVYRLSFGQSLYSVPLIAEVVSFRDAVEDVFELSLVHDGFDWRLFGAGQTSDFMRGDFGGDLSSSPAIEPVSLVITGPTSLEFPEGSGVGMILDYSTGQLKRLDYGYSCSLSERYSQEETPLNVNYEVSGWHYITLKVTDASSNVAYAVDSVYVKELISPDISFTVDESRCIANANTFTSESSTLENIVSYSWDFDGDGVEDSSEPNPTYQFSSAGEYTVILTIGDGSSCGNTARETIMVYAGPPSPDFSVDQTAYCAGEDVTLTNLSDDAAYGEGLTYHWSTELGDTTSIAPVFNFDQPGEKTISLYSSIPGCDSEILTKTVSILALPEIVFQADTACHGEFTEFTNLSEGTSFAWTFGDGFTSNAKSPEHFYTEPGLYEVAISNIDENGCENFLAKQVIVGAIPEAEFEYDIACQGDETILSDVSIVNGADIVEWEWYIEDTPVSQDKNPGVYFDREGSQTVTMTVVSSNGCTASYSESIDVLGQPQVDFSVERACQGDFTSFVDQTTNPDQIISRTWQINGETQASDNDTLNYAFVEPGIYEVSLMVNNRSLCTAEQTKTIEILALPELDFLIDGVCENELITVLDQSVAINDAIVSRRWLLNGTFIGNGSKIEIPADVSGLHDVTLEVVTKFGCSLSRTETIEVYARPEVAFTPANDFGVPPFSLVFENETINGQSYKWYINGDLTSEEMTPSLSFGTEGLQTVKLVATNENGCMDSLSTQIESILPVVDLVVNEIQLIEDRGLQKILLDVSNKSNLPVELFEVQITLENEFTLSENVTRRINKGKDAVIGLSVSLPSISNLGYLCVSLVAPYNVPDQIPENNEGCINLESRTIFEPAFPNPATDRTHIRMILPLDGDVELTILDLSGQVKQQKTLPNRPSGLTTFTIDLQTLQSGTYFIAIKYNGGSHRIRVIKQ